MASTLHFLLILLSFVLIINPLESRAVFNPTTLVLPVQKDGATNLHVASIFKGTPKTLLNLVVDLNGRSTWVNCEQHYLSSTYRAPRCHSTQCSRAFSDNCFTCATSNPRPGCHNQTCGLMTLNPVSQKSIMGELAQDVLTIQSITRSTPSPMVSIPEFLFVCAPSQLLQAGLPLNVHGVVGLGHTPIGLPTQLASHFGFKPKFSMCLTSSPTKNGVVFVGEGPFSMLPRLSNIPRKLSFTPLTISRQGEYYIDLQSIRINQHNLPINPALLSMNNRGSGGVIISTTSPYTVLEHSIYHTFAKIFTDQLPQVPQTSPIAPFGVCYDAKIFSSTPMGRRVPNIDLVFQNQSSVWTIYGANSMVQARPGVLCLGFIDGGMFRGPKASIVIGANLLEDNYVEFDLSMSRVGFSPTLMLQKTCCANLKQAALP